ncbi:MAG: hypothetical protein KF889_18405 [Alphaproteobacteria bacterium]|nr:hypothetical protein [Alphaproteobacteria bacterium]MCW5743960.1 hypothetical protein [Alphaproteobacteria bacterium]
MARRPPKILIVVADSARARFIRPQAGRLVAAGHAGQARGTRPRRGG